MTRLCRGCGDPVTGRDRTTARYCSSACQVLTSNAVHNGSPLPPEAAAQLYADAKAGEIRAWKEMGWGPGPEFTHLCPLPGTLYARCCGRTPFDLPRTDRMTPDPELVTCRG